ncbi:hypothetical protein V5799_030390 [Amblyomma americanum]|uniref:Uncharacterized protein n=1 Tax=Amblyomma americanum TaxID=6943 RepID=A0AAQ4ENE8_AMBAM
MKPSDYFIGLRAPHSRKDEFCSGSNVMRSQNEGAVKWSATRICLFFAVAACNASDCHQRCARENFAKLSNRNNCFTRECFCLFEDRCEKRSCVEGCRGRGRESDGVKGVCTGNACSCRWSW